MNLTYTQLQDTIHFRVLKLRALERLVNSEKFEKLWGLSTEAQRREVFDALNNRDQKTVLRWLRFHPKLDVEDKGLVEVRDLAKRMCIPYWSRKDKETLLKDIKELKCTQRKI